MIFVDISAFYSLLDRDDDNHAMAKQIWQLLLNNGDDLITSNYVVVESTALVQNRLGVNAVEDLHDYFVALVTVHWIEEELHQASLSALRTAKHRPLSLVDCSSFEICRRQGIRQVFTFDKQFAEQGLQLLAA